eukprot:Amastigsp_a1309_61.p6 type:complete len:148 gc:universal Amastigsp_a1309_61:900-1343(+)
MWRALSRACCAWPGPRSRSPRRRTTLSTWARCSSSGWRRAAGPLSLSSISRSSLRFCPGSRSSCSRRRPSSSWPLPACRPSSTHDSCPRSSVSSLRSPSARCTKRSTRSSRSRAASRRLILPRSCRAARPRFSTANRARSLPAQRRR